MMLLPPAPNTCPICAVEHPDEQPHNAQSLYYQYRFYGIRGRWPTWADAMAHCADDVKAHWREHLDNAGVWSEPKAGEPIADPPGESFNQPIGDVNAGGFGPDVRPPAGGN